MHATIRRYDGVDQDRATELTSKVNETLVPKLSKLPGFAGYYLIEAGGGVFSSLGLFETAEQGTESSNVVATWIRDEKLETLIPTRPRSRPATSLLTATASRARSSSSRPPSQPSEAGDRRQHVRSPASRLCERAPCRSRLAGNRATGRA